MRQETLIRELKRRQGERSLRQFAAELGVAPSYLSDVYRGRREPGPKILRLLGVRKRVTRSVEYEVRSPESRRVERRFKAAPRHAGPALGQVSEADLDFHPVEIRGEPLSATILRERR
jgi:transcriptional regulator with XRE-family HTH domain